MSEVKSNSASKALFWGLLLVFVLSYLLMSMGGIFLGVGPFFKVFGIEHFARDVGFRSIIWPHSIVGILRPFTFFLIYVLVVGSLVYRDASKRGMDPWLWAAVAAFVPFLIGVVIYLVVRSNGQIVCANCGRTIRSDYKVCPYCGKSRELLCSGCRRPVAPEWKICPYCETRLEPAAAPEPGRG